MWAENYTLIGLIGANFALFKRKKMRTHGRAATERQPVSSLSGEVSEAPSAQRREAGAFGPAGSGPRRPCFWPLSTGLVPDSGVPTGRENQMRPAKGGTASDPSNDSENRALAWRLLYVQNCPEAVHACKLIQSPKRPRRRRGNWGLGRAWNRSQVHGLGLKPGKRTCPRPHI